MIITSEYRIAWAVSSPAQTANATAARISTPPFRTYDPSEGSVPKRQMPRIQEGFFFPASSGTQGVLRGKRTFVYLWPTYIRPNAH
jgi:hypothetical protein